MNAPPLRTVCLPPHRLTPGMVVARPVQRSDGGVLLSAGTVIDESEMAKLVQRGVEFVFVTVPETRDPATIAADEAAARDRLARLFRASGDAPSDSRDALREAVTAFRLGR